MVCKIFGCKTDVPIIEAWASKQWRKRSIYLCRRCLKPVGEKYYNARGKSISLILNKISEKNFLKSTLSGCIIEKVGNSIKISKENNEKL